MIISIPDISQPPVSRILRIQAGQQALPLAKFSHFIAVTVLAGTLDR
jgi:hypothetical protein